MGDHRDVSTPPVGRSLPHVANERLVGRPLELARDVTAGALSMSCYSEFCVHSSLSSVSGVLLRSRSARWPIIREGEGCREVANPGILEVAGKGGDRELVELAVPAKPSLTNIAEQGIDNIVRA